MMENFGYKSGEFMVVHENGIIKITTDKNTLIYMSPDKFVDFWGLCGMVAKRIVTKGR